jgi:hypothetical protein
VVSWSSVAFPPVAGDRIYVVLFSFRSSGTATISDTSGWTLIGRTDQPITGSSLVFTSAFWWRTATATSADDFNPTVSSAFYTGSPQAWQAQGFCFKDAVGAQSAAFVLSDHADGAGTNFTPSGPVITRGTSAAITFIANRSTGGVITPVSGWDLARYQVAGRAGSVILALKNESSPTTPTMFSTSVGDATASALSFALSGIPDDAADWGVDQIKW